VLVWTSRRFTASGVNRTCTRLVPGIGMIVAGFSSVSAWGLDLAQPASERPTRANMDRASNRGLRIGVVLSGGRRGGLGGRGWGGSGVGRGVAGGGWPVVGAAAAGAWWPVGGQGPVTAAAEGAAASAVGAATAAVESAVAEAGSDTRPFPFPFPVPLPTSGAF